MKSRNDTPRTARPRRFPIRAVFFALGLAVSCGHPGAAADEAPETARTLSLSLQEAVGRALENNVAVKLARERIEETKGLRMESRADLLPHVSLNASQGRVFWQNLAAEGLTDFGVLGPFNSFDAHVQLVQRVFDMSALSGFRAQEAGLQIARLEEGFVRQQVMLSAVLSYLSVLKSEEELRARDEDIGLAQDLVTMAQHQLDAGTATKLDLVRAKTRLAQQTALRQDAVQGLQTATLGLMRATGLPFGTDVRLSDSLRFSEEEALPLEDALDAAYEDRIEMSLAKDRVSYESRKLAQAENERLPALDIYGSYGRAGETPAGSPHDVGAIGVQVTMPVFEGGGIAGRIRQHASRARSEEIRRDDVAVQIEEDVRLALQTLTTSRDRVRAAREALDLARSEVELAQNQYDAGTQDNIAVLQALDALARAHEAYISAVTQYQVGRVNYFSALGRTASFRLVSSKE
ncbi:MAG: TolC family protein [Deltaproteobacteria bacterium]